MNTAIRFIKPFKNLSNDSAAPWQEPSWLLAAITSFPSSSSLPASSLGAWRPDGSVYRIKQAPPKRLSKVIRSIFSFPCARTVKYGSPIAGNGHPRRSSGSWDFENLKEKLFMIVGLKIHKKLVLYCNPLEFLLKQLDYRPSFSMSDRQLGCTSFTIRS